MHNRPISCHEAWCCPAVEMKKRLQQNIITVVTSDKCLMQHMQSCVQMSGGHTASAS